MNVLMPAVNPVIVETGLFGLVIMPDPEIFVHVPVPPPVAVFAAIKGVDPTHTVWLGPAFAIWHCALRKLKFNTESKAIRIRHNLPGVIVNVLGLILTNLEPTKSK